MTAPELSDIRLHEDPDLFREAVNYTAAETAFAPRIIEQDYFCTLLLAYLATTEAELVFKGGTCLAKVHAGFYRLSEDLDFVIPMVAEATRKERSSRATGLKKVVLGIAGRLPVFQMGQPLTGASASRQYVAVIRYRSLLTGLENDIKLEVELREPLLKPTLEGSARTLLIDPVSGRPFVKPVPVTCLSKLESFAEKFREALSRREVAIRDFFDIDYAVRKLGVIPGDPELVNLIRRELAVPGNEPIDVSVNRLAVLRRQLEPHLKPVLRSRDLAEFDLTRAYRTVADVAALLARARQRPTSLGVTNAGQQ